MKSNLDLFIFAGEPSGDLHGELLVKNLLKNRNITISGVCGPRMRKFVPNIFLPMEEFQIMGFLEVLKFLPKLFSLFRKVRDHILQVNPKVVVLVDYPEFNLKLAASLKKRGFSGKIIHYICPSIWAWRKNRIFSMEKCLDLLFTIFPFEKKYFAKTSLQVKYTGHPLIERVTDYKTQGVKTYPGKLISIFPGSRKKELIDNLPLQISVAKALMSKDPELKLAISVANPSFLNFIKELTPPNALLVESFNNYDLMSSSSLAIAKSGTVNLELALFSIPTVVTYKIGKIDCFIARKIFKIDLPFYCIVNILLNKEIFPELFGPNLTYEKLLYHAENLLFSQNKRQECIQKCLEVQEILAYKNIDSPIYDEISQLL